MRNIVFLFISVFIISSFFEFLRADEYYGVSVGEFSGHDVEGEVFLVNSTHLQIIGFRTISKNLQTMPLILVSSSGQRSTPTVFQYHSSANGGWLEQLVSLDGEGQKTHTRLIIKMAGAAAQWNQFAVVDSLANIVSTVYLSQNVPRSFCCFEREPDMGLFGEYGIISDPIEVIDSRTLRIPMFSYRASQTPDGYFFAGTGSEINQNTGKKAVILQNDSTYNSCPMVKDIIDQDMIIRLDESQTIYDIEWISVFCYKYSHDFGHLDIGLVENEDHVPPYIPQSRTFESSNLAQSC